MRLTVTAKPRSRRESVTVLRTDDGDPHLVVRVHAAAVDGAANEAVTKAVARALGVRAWQVALARGHRSRSKIVTVAAPDEAVRAALALLREETAGQ